MKIRSVTGEDYYTVSPLINDWWGGRNMADMLPKLFFEHFTETSFIAEENGIMVGFLIGFLSQSHPDEAYIHFVGIHPDYRKNGIGSHLYETFFTAVQAHNCRTVRCVTSPVNTGSIAYHTKMGFSIESVRPNYDGPGQDRVLFVKRL
ncbi:GNAT family N-acetyltransferase [Ectobacillus sp. JY-23]|uniref:GNAT family N-acetyltransferase n=1 Tax=Ectobacillus sp. JY-23 TaxID=2933872 RepID=UPI001FF23B2A|nr:GNAT family N-acetyltransferase [Ectobacillus sp. JY-23]UOY92289.1 GNAT family N-acetyltransferase [Ectobacillus sp. JY-23]